ncbi:hypothetical protein B0J18DRAFT_442924 [Chaetomium sp. MPI-SDFR-AT-0129]|nr:hypothetical protein B0J18DRAFT_442924 [Chaetomium sp. MPI-SDFR-AT-0129]
MPAVFSPTLYQEGRRLDLQVWKSYSPNLSVPSRITATINRVISMAMSVVLDVTFQTHQGPPVHCVLKLYDRRFGSCLRDVCKDKAAPYTQENEAAFEAFVKGGMMPAFLRYRKQRNETETFPVRAREFLDEPDGTGGLAKYEAALWQDYIEQFKCEIQAYHRLTDLQGTLVPLIYAHVSLSATKLATIIPQEVTPYFETWHHIIQLAVDVAYEINKRGIIMEDCTPCNVVVDKKSQTLRIVDLAQCLFQDEMVSYWCQLGWDEDEDWDSDAEFWEEVRTIGNPRKTGVKMDFRYPDWNGIIVEIRQRKE